MSLSASKALDVASAFEASEDRGHDVGLKAQATFGVISRRRTTSASSR